MDYKKDGIVNQRHFISRIVDLLLVSPYFCKELTELVEKHEANIETMPQVRKRKTSVQQENVPAVLPNYAKVQPKEDFTKTAKYKTIRETKTVLPFENRLPFDTSDVRGWFNRMYGQFF